MGGVHTREGDQTWTYRRCRPVNETILHVVFSSGIRNNKPVCLILILVHNIKSFLYKSLHHKVVPTSLSYSYSCPEQSPSSTNPCTIKSFQQVCRILILVQNIKSFLYKSLHHKAVPRSYIQKSTFADFATTQEEGFAGTKRSGPRTQKKTWGCRF
jgi:hypothetical protein